MAENFKTVNLNPEFIVENFQNLKRCGQEDFVWSSWELKNFLYPLDLKFKLSFGVLDDKEELVAYSVLSMKEYGAHLHMFMVSISHRNSGVGSFMWKEICKRLASYNTSSLHLKVHKTNNNAISFYKRKKMKVIDLIDDHYLMFGDICEKEKSTSTWSASR